MRAFTDLDHRLSVVKRWGTAQTIHQQSVAEHIFNVERIALRIAEHWFGIKDRRILYEIVLWAHHHEDLEAISGDFPSMVKPYFAEEEMAREHADVIPVSRPFNTDVKNIVKLADMLDAWWFLCIERSLGNRYLDNHYDYEPDRIQNFVTDTWPNNLELYADVYHFVEDAREAGSVRHSKRGR